MKKDRRFKSVRRHEVWQNTLLFILAIIAIFVFIAAVSYFRGIQKISYIKDFPIQEVNEEEPAKEPTKNQAPVRVELTKNIKQYNLLQGDLKGREQDFLNYYGDKLGKMVMSVSYAESSGGKSPCGRFNYWSIMSKGKCMNFSSLQDANEAVRKYTGKYYSRLLGLDVNETTVRATFIGTYCQSECGSFVKNFMFAWEKLK